MAHFAEIDENGIVLNVIVADDSLENTGEQILPRTRGGVAMKRTSYNTRAGARVDKNPPQGKQPFRGNFASIGYTYDSDLDAFIPPKPYPSWVLNTRRYVYEPPIPMPNDDLLYDWDEENQTWVRIAEGMTRNDA